MFLLQKINFVNKFLLRKEYNMILSSHLSGQLPDYKVVKAVPVIVLDGDVPKEPRNST